MDITIKCKENCRAIIEELKQHPYIQAYRRFGKYCIQGYSDIDYIWFEDGKFLHNFNINNSSLPHHEVLTEEQAIQHLWEHRKDFNKMTDEGEWKSNIEEAEKRMETW